MTILRALGRWLAEFLSNALVDVWRDEQARRDAHAHGAAEHAAQMNKEAADAERRMAEANARPRSRDDAARRLRNGDA